MEIPSSLRHKKHHINRLGSINHHSLDVFHFERNETAGQQNSNLKQRMKTDLCDFTRPNSLPQKPSIECDKYIRHWGLAVPHSENPEFRLEDKPHSG